MKILRTLMLMLALALLLSSCGGISGDDAIELAKQAAYKIASPPRVYNGLVTDAAHNDTSALRSWPDKPGSVAGSYTITGGYFLTPADSQGVITLTTALSPYSLGSGWLVTFQSSWSNRSHRWQFHVVGDGKAELTLEDGDRLPDMPR